MFEEFRRVGREINWALSMVEEPENEPITLEEAKTHLRVDFSDDDAYISALIIAARMITEEQTCRALVTQKWDMVLDCFPWSNTITLRKPKLQSVESIKYKDCDGIEHIFDTSDYIVDASSVPGRIVLGYSKIWPSVPLQPASAVTIRFTAGYVDASAVPTPLKQAMFLLISQWYENREPVMTTTRLQFVPIPMTFNFLIGPYKVWRFI